MASSMFREQYHPYLPVVAAPLSSIQEEEGCIALEKICRGAGQLSAAEIFKDVLSGIANRYGQYHNIHPRF